jgi:hypothetical protein
MALRKRDGQAKKSVIAVIACGVIIGVIILVIEYKSGFFIKTGAEAPSRNEAGFKPARSEAPIGTGFQHSGATVLGSSGPKAEHSLVGVWKSGFVFSAEEMHWGPKDGSKACLEIAITKLGDYTFLFATSTEKKYASYLYCNHVYSDGALSLSLARVPRNEGKSLQARGRISWINKDQIVLEIQDASDPNVFYFKLGRRIELFREPGNSHEAMKYWWRGQAHAANGDYDLSIADYTEAIRLDPSDTYYDYRARSHFQKANYDQAIADCTEAIRIRPDLVSARITRGACYSAKGNSEEAIADYSAAIRLDPKDALAYNNRGIVYRKMGEEKKAQADFDEAARLDPKRSK